MHHQCTNMPLGMPVYRVNVLDGYLSNGWLVHRHFCLFCDKFLKELQNHSHLGTPVEFAVWGSHGKIYRCWIPPITNAPKPSNWASDYATKVISCVETRPQRRQPRVVELVLPPVDGDSPRWSDGGRKTFRKLAVILTIIVIVNGVGVGWGFW